MTLSYSDFVGLANIAYNFGQNDQSETINGIKYLVEGTTSASFSGAYYQGIILYNPLTKNLIIANCGTLPGLTGAGLADKIIDGVMATAGVLLQWQAAEVFAQEAQTIATSLGATAVYAVGHSLGGSLAQLECAQFGWTGVTFNAYGAAQVAAQIPGFTYSLSANVKNYRDMFDVVSDVSPEIGYAPIVIETQADAAFVANQQNETISNLLSLIAYDHGLNNFYSAAQLQGIQQVVS